MGSIHIVFLYFTFLNSSFYFVFELILLHPFKCYFENLVFSLYLPKHRHLYLASDFRPHLSFDLHLHHHDLRNDVDKPFQKGF